MTEAERIADQHRRAFDGEAWHGPHLFSLLEGVDAARAARRTIPSAHSIWEITAHIRAWEEVALRRLRGESVSLTDDQDWPAPEAETPEAWKRTLLALRATHDELNGVIASLADARLEERTPGSPTSVYHLLHGVVQHALYHAGQIAILKRSNSITP